MLYLLILHSYSSNASSSLQMWNQIYLTLCASRSICEAFTQRPHQDRSPLTVSNASSNRARALALEEKRGGWEYGPSIAGDTAFYPTGSIGGPVAKQVVDRFSDFLDTVHANVINDSRIAAASVLVVCNPNPPTFQPSKLTHVRRVD